MNKKTLYIGLGVVVGLVCLVAGIFWLRNRNMIDDDRSITGPIIAPSTPSSTVPVVPEIERGVDSDNDSLTDTEESALGTDPKKFDTDDDGIGDHEEVVSGSDPKNPSSIPVRESRPEATSIDPVFTTSSALETAPSEAVSDIDTDNDTIPDGEERFFGTDPLKADTDGDTFPDADEIKNGYNPLGPGQCTVKNCVINQ